MKLSKKILLATAAILAVGLVFSGCKKEEDEHGIIDGSWNNGSTNYTNDSKVTQRAFTVSRTKHNGSTALITLTPTKKSASTGASPDGNVGFMWNVEYNEKLKVDDKEYPVYSFLVSTVRYKPDTQNLQTYVSYYKNVYPKEGNLDGDNNFKCVCGKEIQSTPCTKCGAYEKQLIPTTGTWYDLGNIAQYADGDSYSIAIRAVRKTESGNETYAADDEAFTMIYATKAEYEALSRKDKTEMESATLGDSTSLVIKAGDCELTGQKKSSGGTQKDTGIYTMVQPGQTLKASWKCLDNVNNPILTDGSEIGLNPIIIE